MPHPKQDQTHEQYVIRGGKPGRDRLEILNRVLAPTTLGFFQRAGIATGQSGLDLGCGGTTLTQELARLVGSQGKVLGIDKDTENITHARQEAKVLGLSQLHYHVADIVQWEGESSQYDFAFSRFLLTHLPNPLELLRQVYLSLKPGGRMLLEDIRYVALYTATVQHTGADPNIGPSLPSLLQDAGFRHIQCTLVQPVFQRGEGKQISSLTLEFIAESLIHNQLASREAITTYLAELRAFEQDETTLVSLPRIFQVWAVTLRLHLFGPSAKSTDEIDQLTNEYFEHLASYYQAEPGLHGSETMIMTLVLRRR